MAVETFSVLAVIKAIDEISGVLDKIDKNLGKFAETAADAAKAAAESGSLIDESLLSTISGADAVELATARLEASREKLALATEAQVKAELKLVDVQSSISTEEELAAATDAVTAAQSRAAAAARDLAVAQQAALEATQAEDADLASIAKATDAVSAAQARATAATKDLTAARAQQNALVTPEDAVKAADALAAAERSTAAATREASAAEEYQKSVTDAAAFAAAKAAGATDAEAAAQIGLADATGKATGSLGRMGAPLGLVALATAGIGAVAVKAAANFQSATTHLVTDAGVSANAIDGVRAAILQVSADTGTSAAQVTQAMYHISTSGIKAQQAIDVMRVAAEGAKVGNADLDTVSRALAGTLVSFTGKGYSATQMMNALITTTASGDVTLQNLTTGLGNVVPNAASAGLGFEQVGGAIATMTSQSVSAQRATMQLNRMISSLENPSNIASKEMAALGLSATDVSQHIGQRGLTGTLDVLTNAIATHMGPAGQVLLQTLTKSQLAASQANQILAAMPANMRNIATAWASGTTTTKTFNKAISDLAPAQQTMYKQFESLTKKSGDFTAAVSGNSTTAQTLNAALAKMVGGTTGLSAALMLTGKHAVAFDGNVKTIGTSLSSNGKAVDNWSTIQGTFNQKMDRAKASVEAMGISMGTVLLPAVSKTMGAIADVLGPTASWIERNQKLVGLIATVVGVLITGIGIIYTVTKATQLWTAVTKLLGAAMTDTPIGLIIVAIAALVAGIIYAYTHFKTFHDVVNNVAKAVGGAFVAMWHALETAFKAIVTAAAVTWHALETAWNGVVGAAKAVWHFLEAAWNSIVSVTLSVWNSIADFFKKWWPLLLVIFMAPIAVIMAIWNHFGNDIMTAARVTWDAVAGFFKTIWNDLVIAAKFTWNLIKQYIVQPMELVWRFIVSVWNSINAAIVGAVNWVMGYIRQAWSLIYQYIVYPLEQAWHMVTRIFGDIVNAITSAINGVLGWLSGIGSWFVNIGAEIINGIIKGIENAAGSLFNILGGIANGALKAAKSFLGIGSPSKEFAEQVGKWIPHGIALGVTQHAIVATSAVAKLAGALPGQAKAAIGSQPIGTGLAYTGSGASAGGGLTIHNHFEGAHFMTDKDMDKMADLLGKRLATQILPRGGVRIRS